MQADGVFQRHRHLFEEHLGCRWRMPRWSQLHDTDAWAVAAHQPGTHAGIGSSLRAHTASQVRPGMPVV